MNIKRSIMVMLAALLVFYFILQEPQTVGAQSTDGSHELTVYLFWGDGCPHCAKAKPYFESLTLRYPGMHLVDFEIYSNQANQELFVLMLRKFGLEQVAVPTIFIGPYYLQGYSEELNEDIEKVIEYCLLNGCTDAGEGIINQTLEVHPTPIPQDSETRFLTEDGNESALGNNAEAIEPGSPGSLNRIQSLDIPLIGVVDLDEQSLALSTLLIALVDGFNPCSVWVLTMLLALTLHTGSRKKVIIIGVVFLTVTAGIYALFIGGLFSVLQITSFMGWVRIIVALVALGFALVNIKDYFWYKEGISFTIADGKKGDIFKRMRKLTDPNLSMPGLIGTTIVLAAGVSLVEFSCTAGFPIIWVNLLTAQKVSISAFVLLLVEYMLVYQADEMVIFFASVTTLKASKLEEKHGRILKLVSGMLMLALAIVMIIDPTLLNSPAGALMIFLYTFLAILLILFVHRFILPRLGVQIDPGAGRSR